MASSACSAATVSAPTTSECFAITDCGLYGRLLITTLFRARPTFRRSIDILYVARSLTSRIISVNLNVGNRLPAYCTSIGHVLLANLPEGDLDDYLSRAELHPYTERTMTDPEKLRQHLAGVREADYAIADQLLEPTVRSIAVPVRNAVGTVVAGMNVIVQTSRSTLRDRRTLYLPPLQVAARELSAQLVP